MLKNLSTTGIGSLPHIDAKEGCRLVFESVDIPFWPQLPARDFRELMVPQFSEGLPGLRIDAVKKRVWVERDEAAIADFYDAIEKDRDFPISNSYAAGLYEFLKEITDRRFASLKGQITGPITFTLGLTDIERRPIYFDDEMRELSLHLLKRKARFQIRLLKLYADEVIIFIDEPVLSALGTAAYLGINDEDVKRLLQELSDEIRNSGAIPGIHCCSRTNWSLVISSGIVIMNFDAYDYADSIKPYVREIDAFLDRGGYLAWGVVPTTEAIANEDLESIEKVLERGFSTLIEAGIQREKLLLHCLLTPSCGAGSRTVEEAEKIFSILNKLAGGIG